MGQYDSSNQPCQLQQSCEVTNPIEEHEMHPTGAGFAITFASYLQPNRSPSLSCCELGGLDNVCHIQFSRRRCLEPVTPGRLEASIAASALSNHKRDSAVRVAFTVASLTN